MTGQGTVKGGTVTGQGTVKGNSDMAGNSDGGGGGGERTVTGVGEGTVTLEEQ